MYVIGIPAGILFSAFFVYPFKPKTLPFNAVIEIAIPATILFSYFIFTFKSCIMLKYDKHVLMFKNMIKSTATIDIKEIKRARILYGPPPDPNKMKQGSFTIITSSGVKNIYLLSTEILDFISEKLKENGIKFLKLQIIDSHKFTLINPYTEKQITVEENINKIENLDKYFMILYGQEEKQ